MQQYVEPIYVICRRDYTSGFRAGLTAVVFKLGAFQINLKRQASQQYAPV